MVRGRGGCVSGVGAESSVLLFFWTPTNMENILGGRRLKAFQQLRVVRVHLRGNEGLGSSGSRLREKGWIPGRLRGRMNTVWQLVGLWRWRYERFPGVLGMIQLDFCLNGGTSLREHREGHVLLGKWIARETSGHRQSSRRHLWPGLDRYKFET